jgi:biopolymer transport protein ExbD
MSMNTGGNNEEIVAEINMTPLIDIMLVLLIIFMVSSTAALESGLDVNLPQASATNEVKEPEIVVISLSKEGKMAVQGKEVTDESLQGEISHQLKLLNTEVVIFEGDAAAQLGNVVKMMDIAKVAGAKSFSIAAEQSTVAVK